MLKRLEVLNFEYFYDLYPYPKEELLYKIRSTSRSIFSVLHVEELQQEYISSVIRGSATENKEHQQEYIMSVVCGSTREELFYTLRRLLGVYLFCCMWKCYRKSIACLFIQKYYRGDLHHNKEHQKEYILSVVYGCTPEDEHCQEYKLVVCGRTGEELLDTLRSTSRSSSCLMYGEVLQKTSSTR